MRPKFKRRRWTTKDEIFDRREDYANEHDIDFDDIPDDVIEEIREDVLGEQGWLEDLHERSLRDEKDSR